MDNALYSVALRTLHEVIINDTVNAIASVVVNGWAHFTDPATGNPKDEYISSVHATGRQVIDGLSSEDNLAAMEWDDFEHLVGELFEKE